VVAVQVVVAAAIGVAMVLDWEEVVEVDIAST
jgi:hypothetical protein